MGTVKYTGPVASFHCPTNAEIRSLKVHFSPKQEGTGDPSPENVREIVGWDGVEVIKSGINLLNPNATEYDLYTIGSTGSHVTSSLDRISSEYISCPANVSVTLSGMVDHRGMGYIFGFAGIAFFDKDKNFISRVFATEANVITGISPAGTVYMRYFEQYNGIAYPTPAFFATYQRQLEFGSTATAYKPYHGSSTNYEFGVLGKNKLDKSNYKYLNSSIICFGGDTSAEPDGSLFLNAGTYTFSVNATGTIFATDANKRNIAFATDTNTITFTLQESLAVRIVCSFQGATDEEMLAYNYQLELGSTATEYTPYDPNHTVYGGWVDLITGEVEEEYGMVETTWGAMGGADVRGNYERRQLNVSSIGFIGASAGNLNNRPNRRFCNIAPWRWAYYDDQLHYYADMGTAYVFLPINSDDNITIRIVCYLATPNTYNLAPIELQTFLGQNNVWSNADYVEVEYDLHETQDILARKQFIMANQPHIVKPAAAPLQNFTTDVPAPLKECKVYFEPKQDLHGYSNPWPAGDGRNIFHVTAQSQTSETGVVFTVNSDGSVKAVGNPSISTSLDLGTITLPAGTYKIQGGISSTAYLNIPSKVNSYGGAASFTIAEGGETITPRIYITANNEVNDTFYPMIKLNSDNDAAWEPYENICPISGWTDLEVTKCGKNLFNKNDVESGYISAVTTSTRQLGEIIPGNDWRTSNYILVAPLTTYTLSMPNQGNASVAGLVMYSDKKVGKEINGFSLMTMKMATNYYYTFTTLSNCYYIRFAMSTNRIDTVQLEVGPLSTEYESYNSTTIPITFPATVNLFNEQWEQGNIEVGNNAGSSTSMRTDFIDVSPSTSYYLYTPRENNVFIFEYLEDGTYADKVNGVHTSHIFTTGSTTKKIRIVDRNSGTETVNTGINYPSTITYYEPYGTIYGGYIDLVKGTIVKTHELISLKASGLYTNNSDRIFWYTSDIQSLNTINEGVFCNRYKLTRNVSGEERYNCFTWYTNGVVRWVEEGTMNMTLNEYNNYLDTHPLLVTYKLKTPIEFPISNEVLKTLRGTNNVWSNANGNIDLSYWKH